MCVLFLLFPAKSCNLMCFQFQGTKMICMLDYLELQPQLLKVWLNNDCLEVMDITSELSGQFQGLTKQLQQLFKWDIYSLCYLTKEEFSLPPLAPYVVSNRLAAVPWIASRMCCLLSRSSVPRWLPQSSRARAGGSNLQAATGQPKRSCLPLLCFIRKQNIRFPLH